MLAKTKHNELESLAASIGAGADKPAKGRAKVKVENAVASEAKMERAQARAGKVKAGATDNLDIPPFLKRTETPEQKAAREKKLQAERDRLNRIDRSGLKVIKPEGAKPDLVAASKAAKAAREQAAVDKAAKKSGLTLAPVAEMLNAAGKRKRPGIEAPPLTPAQKAAAATPAKATPAKAVKERAPRGEDMDPEKVKALLAAMKKGILYKEACALMGWTAGNGRFSKIAEAAGFKWKGEKREGRQLFMTITKA